MHASEHCGLSRRAGGAAAWLVLLLVSPVAARADQTTATLEVRIVGAPVGAAAGPAVAAVRPADEPAAPAKTGQTSGSGPAVFAGLPAGTYHVRVERPGAAAASADVRVDAAEVVWIEATLAPGQSRLRVRDRSREGQGTDLRADALRHLPSGGNIWSLVDTAVPSAIVSRIDGGGINTAEPAVIGSRGASWTTTSFALGDLDVTSPGRAGTPLMYPDVNAFETISVTYGIAPVDFGEPGAAISLVPRRPGATRRGTVEASFTSAGMVAANASLRVPSIAAIESWRDGGFQWGGPLTARVGAFVSAGVTRSRHHAGTPAVFTDDVASLFTHVVFKPTDRDEVRIIGAGQRLSHPYADATQFIGGGLMAQHDLFWQSQLAWERHAASGARLLVAGGIDRGTFTPQVDSSAVGFAVDRLRQGPVPLPPSADAITRWDAKVQFEPRPAQMGGFAHHARLGFTMSGAAESSHEIAAPTVAERVGGLAARVWIWQPPASDSDRHVHAFTGYATDRVALSKNVTVDAGLRVDLSSGSANGATQGITWKTVSPRASMRWTPVSGLAVSGGYGRYHPRVSLAQLTFGDPSAPWAQVYRWNDTNGNLRVDAGELGALVERMGAGPVAGIDPALRSPHTDEYTLGFEGRVSDDLILRATAVIRRERGLVGSINTGVTAAGYRVTMVPDQGVDYTSPDDDRLLPVYERLPASFGQDRYLLTNPAGDNAKYDGIEVTLERRGDRLAMLVGAMAYRALGSGGNAGFRVQENDQGVVGETFANPNVTTYAYGRLFFDRAYVLKWSTMYRGPHDIRVAATARYQDGQPFARMVIAQGLAQGPELVPAYPNGRTRFSYTVTLDARIEKGFRVGARRAAVTFDAFNLTNMENEVEEDPLTGATFRMTTAVQPPRTLRLGFRFEF